MGVLDNLKKIKKAQDNKNAVSKIARKAVVQGKIENDFLAEYNSFSIALKEILENALINDRNESITISANKEKDPEGNNLKYLNYVLQDDEYNTLYTMTMDKASNVTFKLKFIDLSEDNLGDILSDSKTEIDSDYKKEIDYFLND
ncbi:hypothetical protein [Sutterella wadsworthensis]|uniref:hypothetical protein n=1 Tax=Sutterella wadsworthensis TaxID=40545 RepID=UPI0032C14456